MNHNDTLTFTSESNEVLKLNYGFKFKDLFEPIKLKQLTEEFYNFFQKENPEEFEKFSKYRDSKGEGYDAVEISKILINSSRYLNQFIGELFGINDDLEKLKKEVEYERVILNVKKDF